MKIQAFVTTWDKAEENAKNTAYNLSQYCETEILYSVFNRPFAEQWMTALSGFNGDIFLWVMGDVEPPSNLDRFFKSMSGAYETGRVGMYAPNVSWTSQIYNRRKMIEIWPGVYEVCGTDLLITSVSKELLRIAPSIHGNSRGWFYDYALTAYADSIEKKVLRDYNFLALHPKGSNYDMSTAKADADKWLGELPKDKQNSILDLIIEQAWLCS